MCVAKSRWVQVIPGDSRWVQVSPGVTQNSGLHCRWVICDVFGHLLCSETVVPVWHRLILLLLVQTICLLWTSCFHCCPHRDDLSPSDVSGQPSVDRRSRPSCAVHSFLERLFYLPNVQICALHKLHSSVCLSVLAGLKWTGMFVKDPPLMFCHLGNDDVVEFYFM